METDSNFLRRVNSDDREEGDPRPVNESNDGWFFGSRSISAGSLHTDIWEGSAVELASRDLLYVYPITGWWRERKALGRVNSKARYSLIVGLETPEIDTDLITPIAATVDALVKSSIEIES